MRIKLNMVSGCVVITYIRNGIRVVPNRIGRERERQREKSYVVQEGGRKTGGIEKISETPYS